MNEEIIKDISEQIEDDLNQKPDSFSVCNSLNDARLSLIYQVFDLQKYCNSLPDSEAKSQLKSVIESENSTLDLMDKALGNLSKPASALAKEKVKSISVLLEKDMIQRETDKAFVVVFPRPSTKDLHNAMYIPKSLCQIRHNEIAFRFYSNMRFTMFNPYNKHDKIQVSADDLFNIFVGTNTYKSVMTGIQSTNYPKVN